MQLLVSRLADMAKRGCADRVGHVERLRQSHSIGIDVQQALV